MPSWYWDRHRTDDWDDQENAYERELRMAERQHLQDGYTPQEGHTQPTDPACPKHAYGMVDGQCGLCLLETS
jgi:hypothetical protein